MATRLKHEELSTRKIHRFSNGTLTGVTKAVIYHNEWNE